jgi:HK97 gp10 family phage protein
VKVALRGFDELARMLESAPPKAARQILREGVTAVGELWRRTMVELVRRGPHHFPGRDDVFGFLAENIAISVRTTKDLAATLKVGPSVAAFWGKYLEFGTGPRQRTRKGQSDRGHRLFEQYRGTNRMPAIPFARPAFDETEAEALDVFAAKTKQALIDAGIPIR